MTYTPEYAIWKQMKQRCTNPNHSCYHEYKDRGVCERWLVFENFYADMGDRPEGKTLDRINNDLGYSPENCRWSTPAEQQRNQSVSKLSAEDVVEIRHKRSSGMTHAAIAKQYHVSEEHVRLICNGGRHGSIA